LGLLQRLGHLPSIPSHGPILTLLLSFLLLLFLRKSSLLSSRLFILSVLFFLSLPSLLKFESRSHLARAEDDHLRALFGSELLHQLFAALSLLLLVSESLNRFLLSNPFECGLWSAALEVIAESFDDFPGLPVTVLLAIALSFPIPEGESQ
jgi:hypothetical protein